MPRRLEEKIIPAEVSGDAREKNSDNFSGAGFCNRFFPVNQKKSGSTFLKLT
jgi:hypothetical protein